MSLTDRMTVAAAERVGETIGARAGLAALAPLVTKLESNTEAARALFSALAFATELEDLEAAERLVTLYPIVAAGARFVDVVAATELMQRWPALAEALATHEIDRSRSARAFYLRGRLRAREGEEDEAANDFLSAHHRATRHKLPRVAQLAAAQAFTLGKTDLRREVAPAQLPPTLALRFANAALSGTGRYARVAGLDVLLALTNGEDTTTAAHARRLAAEYADTTLSALTEIERDRVRSILRTEPRDDVRQKLLERWQLVEDVLAGATTGKRSDPLRRRIDAVLSARTAGPRPPGPAATWLPLEICARLAPPRVTGDLVGVNALLDELRELLPSLTSISRATYTAITLSLEEPATQDVGRALARDVLGRTSGRRPETGWRRLARALRNAGDDELANEALLIGARKREPGARDDYRVIKSIEARAAYDRGDPEAALRALANRDAV